MNSGPIPSPLGGLREEPRADNDAREEPRDAPRLVLDPDRVRAREGIANIDPFDISDLVAIYSPTRGDPAKGNIDNEISLEWKRWDTYGKQNYAELQEYHQQGWREVLYEMFPGRFARAGATGPVITRDMVLMERPMRLTVKARNEEIEAATQAMRVNQRNLAVTPEGQAPRQVFVDRTSVEAIAIPE